MTDKRLQIPFNFGKTIIQELEWENMKCSKCGTELSKYPQYTDYGEYKICPKCGNRHLLFRRVKND